MSVSIGTVSVTTSAIKIVSQNAKRQELILCNFSTSPDIFIGPDSSVTAATGLPLFGSQSRESSKDFPMWKGDIYGISSSGTADIRYWETSQ